MYLFTRKYSNKQKLSSLFFSELSKHLNNKQNLQKSMEAVWT